MQTPTNMLAHVEKNMDVYDARGNKIGTVDHVQFGDEDPARPGPETATAKTMPTQADHTLVEDFAEAITAASHIPQAMRSRLIRYGFVKLDTGFLRSDRYILPDQIDRVMDDYVQLSATRSDLIKV